MNSDKTYFQYLALSSRVGTVDMTHVGVAPCSLARLMGQARARTADAAPRQQPQPLQAVWRDLVAPIAKTRLTPIPLNGDGVAPC
jgi:hypothetical protein